jgi:hypothetical protein
MQAIKRGRKNFRDIRGKQYSVAEEELAKYLPKNNVSSPQAPVVLPAEISGGPEVGVHDTRSGAFELQPSGPGIVSSESQFRDAD